MRNKTTVLLIVILASAGICLAQMTEEDSARFGLAQSFNNTGDHKKAAEILEQLYKKFPRDQKVAIEYGKALAYGGRPEDAVPVLLKLSEKKPGDSYIIRTLASAYETAQKPGKARAEYIKLLKRLRWR